MLISRTAQASRNSVQTLQHRSLLLHAEKKMRNLNKNFKGGRPSSIIVGEELTPKSLGALLAHFENKIMFQGFVWT